MKRFYLRFAAAMFACAAVLACSEDPVEGPGDTNNPGDTEEPGGDSGNNPPEEVVEPNDVVASLLEASGEPQEVTFADEALKFDLHVTLDQAANRDLTFTLGPNKNITADYPEYTALDANCYTLTTEVTVKEGETEAEASLTVNSLPQAGKYAVAVWLVSGGDEHTTLSNINSAVYLITLDEVEVPSAGTRYKKATTFVKGNEYIFTTEKDGVLYTFTTNVHDAVGTMKFEDTDMKVVDDSTIEGNGDPFAVKVGDEDEFGYYLESVLCPGYYLSNGATLEFIAMDFYPSMFDIDGEYLKGNMGWAGGDFYVEFDNKYEWVASNMKSVVTVYEKEGGSSVEPKPDPQPAAGDTFRKVTGFTTGNEYIITAESGGNTYTFRNNGDFSGVNLFVEGGFVKEGDDTIKGDGSGYVLTAGNEGSYGHELKTPGGLNLSANGSSLVFTDSYFDNFSFNEGRLQSYIFYPYAYYVSFNGSWFAHTDLSSSSVITVYEKVK
ncbi:MAG: DUF1735 domain-containing protein [Alistipes sp.]|nr:DUF1735 domain-containing protein [Alistipes sp.]